MGTKRTRRPYPSSNRATGAMMCPPNPYQLPNPPTPIPRLMPATANWLRNIGGRGLPRPEGDLIAGELGKRRPHPSPSRPLPTLPQVTPPPWQVNHIPVVADRYWGDQGQEGWVLPEEEDIAALSLPLISADAVMAANAAMVTPSSGGGGMSPASGDIEVIHGVINPRITAAVGGLRDSLRQCCKVELFTACLVALRAELRASKSTAKAMAKRGLRGTPGSGRVQRTSFAFAVRFIELMNGIKLVEAEALSRDWADPLHRHTLMLMLRSALGHKLSNLLYFTN